MKRLFSVLCLFVLALPAFAFDAQVKGFLALDLAMMSQVEGKRTAIETGIGVLDLKVFAEQEDVSAKFKLDLDDSSIGEAYNIFEEATASYRFNKQNKLTAGKGVVPFHHLHWGALENSYIDGGTVIGVFPYWSDVDEKIILSYNYRNQDHHFSNSFTFWGDSEQYKRNSSGEFYTTPSSNTGTELSKENKKTFITTDEWGLANKFEYSPIKGLEFSLGAIVYDHDLNPDLNWALDFGAGYELEKMEFWFEKMYGKGSTPQFAKYSSFSKIDDTYQLGAEFYGTELINYVVNTEYAHINDHSWGRNATYTNFNKYGTVETDTKTVKLDLAVKFKISKTAQVCVGAVGEKQWTKTTYIDTSKNSDTDKNAGEFGTTFSFWF